MTLKAVGDASQYSAVQARTHDAHFCRRPQHILALQSHNARMSGQVFLVEGVKHSLPYRGTMQE